MLVVIFNLRTFIPTYWGVLIGVVIGLVVYIAVLLLLRTIEREDILIMRKLINPDMKRLLGIIDLLEKYLG